MGCVKSVQIDNTRDYGSACYGHPDEMKKREYTIGEMSMAEFLEDHSECQTGTILVKGVSPARLKEMGDKLDNLVRDGLNGSFFTHAVLILRQPPEQILREYGCQERDPTCVYGFECSFSNGIRVVPLTRIISEWMYYYGIRSYEDEKDWVLCSRKPSLEFGAIKHEEALWNFMKQNKHKRYGFCFSDFASMVGRSLSGSGDSRNNRSPSNKKSNKSKKRNVHFCSSLVTESLLSMGLLRDSCPCYEVFPGDFLPGGLISQHTAKGVSFGQYTRLTQVSDVCIPVRPDTKQFDGHECSSQGYYIDVARIRKIANLASSIRKITSLEALKTSRVSPV